MKYEVIIAKNGRRLYYATPKEGRKRLVSADNIPKNVLDNLTPGNPVHTESLGDTVKNIQESQAEPEYSREFIAQREEAEDGLEDDTSVPIKQPEENQSTVEAEDDNLLVDEDEYESPEPQPIEVKKIPQPEAQKIVPKECLFGDGQGTKVKRINMMDVKLCDIHYYESTPGKIVEQLRKLQEVSQERQEKEICQIPE